MAHEDIDGAPSPSGRDADTVGKPFEEKAAQAFTTIDDGLQLSCARVNVMNGSDGVM